MKRTRLIALSGVCGAVALASLLIASYVKWIAFAFAVLAAVAVSCPLIVDAKYGLYGFLTYLSVSVLGVLLGAGNMAYVAPIVSFAIPFCMWKVYCESPREEKQAATEDDFFSPPPKRSKKRVPTAIKWLVYFVLCECGLALSALALHLFAPAVLENLISLRYVWWIALIGNAAVVPYHFLLSGAIHLTRSAMRKAKFF